MPDLFTPENESAADREWRLELTTVARLLSTRPNERRATKIDCPKAIYRIDDRRTEKPLAFLGFQNIAREYAPDNPAPVFADHVRDIVRQSELEGLAAFMAFHWVDSHWGFARLPAFFEIDDILAKAPGNDSIRLISPDSFVAIYQYTRTESTKIGPNKQ